MDMLRWEYSKARKGCADMNKLPDELLLEAYAAAVKLKLDPDFIRMLAAEMARRNLKPGAVQIGA